MALNLDDLLSLVGVLDDSDSEDCASSRFRTYLREKVGETGLLRDYVETCLRQSGSQYCRALQDLVNRVGEILGFTVAYGRYAGRQGAIGYDGHWVSPTGAHIVVEVKTTDAYTIQTATLLNYVNQLISAGRIEQADRRVGLYVVGRPDASLTQLENAIVAENRLTELRIASVDSVLSLADLATQYDMDHRAIVDVLFPSGPRVDPTVDLMASLVAQEGERDLSQPSVAPPSKPALCGEAGGPRHYMTPVRWKGRRSPLEEIGRLLAAGKYAFAERTPCRRDMRAGDWLCFYASAFGVFAHARIMSEARDQPLPDITNDADSYPWTLDLGDVAIYEESAVELTPAVRAQLDAFHGLDVGRPWGWFVTPTRTVTRHDFLVLTGQGSIPSSSDGP